MRTESKKGLFITFEGGEGAGKTTLIEAIAHHLSSKGYSVLKTREPGGTQLGEACRTILLQGSVPMSPYAELSLFLASRAQHVFEVIAPALQAKKIVLCDRFNDSSVAYQGVARGLGKEAVAAFCRFISQGVKPDLTLYLDLDPNVGLKRVAMTRQTDRIETETILFHQKIREAYLEIQKEEPNRFRLIDATLPEPQVYSAAMKFIEPLLSHV